MPQQIRQSYSMRTHLQKKLSHIIIALIITLMFNSHIAEKQYEQVTKSAKQKRKIENWNKRYKTEVRPSLIDRYNRRINGFAKKMEDEPIVVKITHNGPIDDALVRSFDRSLNITRQNFMFKNSDDWKSIYTPIERKQRQQTINSFHNKSNQLMALRSIWSQSKYANKKTEYRLRQKQKQINPPMKYTNKNSEHILTALPKIRNKYRLRKNQTEHINMERMKSITSTDSDAGKQHAENLSHGEIDFTLLGGSQLIRKPFQPYLKTEKQLMEEQQMKALAHKRLYFKSLIDLEQHVKTAKQKYLLKEVLVKCGIFKPVNGKKYEQEQVDRFLEMMKTKQV